MGNFDLDSGAYRFAKEIQDVLNGTVCHGVTIRAVRADREVFKVGYKITSDDYRVAPIPLTISAKKPTGYLGISYGLSADREGHNLMVRSSVLAYSDDDDLDHPLIHYDYERDKGNDYPQSHLQVCAESTAWEAIRAARGLSKNFDALHLPLGGRRFRPTIEDLVRFLIAEKLADRREEWESALDIGYARYEAAQVGAVVRRHRQLAQDTLRELDRLDAETVRRGLRRN